MHEHQLPSENGLVDSSCTGQPSSSDAEDFSENKDDFFDYSPSVTEEPIAYELESKSLSQVSYCLVAEDIYVGMLSYYH